MSLIRKIAFNTGAQVGGKILSTVLGLIAIMIMTRTLGTEKFGWYATAAGFLQFVGLLSDFGFNITTTNMLAEPRPDKTRLVNVIFSWRILTALIFNGLAPVIFLFFPYPAPVKWAVLIISISFLALAFNQVLIGYYQATVQAARIALAEIVSRLSLVGGIALVAVYGSGFLWLMAVISLAAIINSTALALSGPKFKFDFDRATSAALFKKIWPNAMGVMLNSFYSQGDRVILPLFVAPAIVGVYAASYRVLDIVIQISALIMGIMMPLATAAWAQGDKEEFKRHYEMSLNLVAIIVVPLLAGVFALSGPILRFVAGEQFAGGGMLLRLLSLSLLGVCFGMVFGHLNLALDRQRQALKVFGSNAILSVIAYFIFIPRFGAYGAAGVTIFSEFYTGALLFLMAGRFSQVWPRLKTFGKILSSAFVMAVVLLVLPAWNLVVLVALGAIIYSGLILLSGVITAQDWDEIKQSPVLVAPDAINKV